VTRSSLGPAFLTSVAIHLGALVALSLAWGWLRVFPHSASLDGTELVMVAPIAQPMESEEPVEIAPPPPALGEESITVPSLPPGPSEPVPPPQLEPITPPKIIDQPAPKRVEPRPKPVPPRKPARVKKPSPDIANQAATGPRETRRGAMEGTPHPVLARRSPMRHERPPQEIRWGHPQRRELRMAPWHRWRAERLARETSSRGEMLGSFQGPVKAVAAALVGEAAWGWETAPVEHGRGALDRGRGARDPVKAVARRACRPAAIKSNRVIRIRPGDGGSKGLSSSRRMSPNRGAWNRSRLNNRLDMRISTRRPSRLWAAGASSLLAGVGSRSRCGCRFL